MIITGKWGGGSLRGFVKFFIIALYVHVFSKKIPLKCSEDLYLNFF